MPEATGYFGMRGSGNWSADERPKNWREKILEMDPNGDTPLMGLLSKTKSETTDDPEFSWWEESLAGQAGDLVDSGLYKEQSLATAYGAGDAILAGGTLYAKVDEATVNQVREGHIVLLRYYNVDAPDSSRDRRGKVVGRISNGGASVLAIKMRQADVASATNLSTANRILVIGNSNPEGGSMPDGIQYNPTKRVNYTQIFRTPLRFTGTALSMKTRDTNDYKRQKAQVLKYHGLEMEKALIFNGAPLEEPGSNGKPERESGGLKYWIETYAAANVDNFCRSADVAASTTWLNGGNTWLDLQLEKIFKYGRNKKLALCGTGALNALNGIAKQYGTIQLTPRDRVYGLSVVEWVTPFGVLDLMTHPLFSHEKTENTSMMIVEPENIKVRPLEGRDTFYKKDDRLERGGAGGVDGIEEEYLTEIGWEINFPETMGMLTGLGKTHIA